MEDAAKTPTAPEVLDKRTKAYKQQVQAQAQAAPAPTIPAGSIVVPKMLLERCKRILSDNAVTYLFPREMPKLLQDIDDMLK